VKVDSHEVQENQSTQLCAATYPGPTSVGELSFLSEDSQALEGSGTLLEGRNLVCRMLPGDDDSDDEQGPKPSPLLLPFASVSKNPCSDQLCDGAHQRCTRQAAGYDNRLCLNQRHLRSPAKHRPE
jgi:hypothetical protein